LYEITLVEGVDQNEKIFYARSVDMAYNTSENRMLARLLIGKLGKLDMLHPDAAK